MNRMIPFVELRSQYQDIKPEIDAAVAAVLQRGHFILGENVEKFEEEFCRYLGGRYAVSVGSGTDALTLALMAADIGAGDEVITVSHSFVATALAVLRIGVVPVFVDIDPHSFNLDAYRLEAAVTGRTRAIMPVHLYGQPADMKIIGEVARKYNLTVIEDACQAHGAAIGEKKAGLWGHMACFSFYPAKNLGAYGDGGMVVTGAEDSRDKLLYLRNYGQREKYHHDFFGVNSRLDEIQAAVLRVKLKHLDKWNERRRKIADTYSREIQSEFVTCPAEREGVHHVYHLYVIRTPFRAELQQWLQEREIATQIHYPLPIHRQRFYTQQYPPTVGLPETERAASEVLSLPMYPELTDDAVARVVEAINDFKR